MLQVRVWSCGRLGTSPAASERLIGAVLYPVGQRNDHVNNSGGIRAGQNHPLMQGGDRPATGGARRLIARSRLSPIRGYTSSAPRYGLRGVCRLKQMPNAMFQQFDSPLQGAELSDPH